MNVQAVKNTMSQALTLVQRTGQTAYCDALPRAMNHLGERCPGVPTEQIAYMAGVGLFGTLYLLEEPLKIAARKLVPVIQPVVVKVASLPPVKKAIPPVMRTVPKIQKAIATRPVQLGYQATRQAVTAFLKSKAWF